MARPPAEGRFRPPFSFFKRKRAAAGPKEKFYLTEIALATQPGFSGFRRDLLPVAPGPALSAPLSATQAGVESDSPPGWVTPPQSGAGVEGRRSWRERQVSGSGNQRRGDSIFMRRR